MPVTGLKIDSTADMSDRDVIVACKDTITKMQGLSFKHSIKKGWKGMGSR